MSRRKPKYPPEEFERRADECFENHIKQKMVGQNPHDYLAIDVDTGDYEVDASVVEATDRLRTRNPDAQIWTRRVGSRFAVRFGYYGVASPQ